MKNRKIFLEYNAYFQKGIFSQVKFFIFHSQVFYFTAKEQNCKSNITQKL